MRINVEGGYEPLARVLLMALDQAQAGKGKDRHANGMVFESQPIVRLPMLQKSTKGLNYQVCKKTIESENLPSLERKVSERLGAIVYLAASILVEYSLAQVPLLSPAEEIGVPDKSDDALAFVRSLEEELRAGESITISRDSLIHKRILDIVTEELPF